MVSPVVHIQKDTTTSKIGVEVYLSETSPKKYWCSDNGVAAISNVVYDQNNPMDVLTYITQKYDAPNGWSFIDWGSSEASNIELSGSI